MARTVTGDGIAPASEKKNPQRYYAYNCGPMFACGANYGQACAWGAVKVMLAFSAWPGALRTPAIQAAIDAGAEFLLAGDPAKAGYPNGITDHPSSDWWKFGFPVFYITDLLQNAQALLALGYGRDPRLAAAMQIVREKGESDQRWFSEYNYNSKTWINFDGKRQPSKWVTLRALRALKWHESAFEVVAN
jgi:hypothetical protein